MLKNKYDLQYSFKILVAQIFLMAVSLSCLFPLFWMFRSALMTNDTVFTDKALIPHEIHFGNFLQAWNET